MSSVVCPICSGSFEANLSVSMPFCSARCRQIDLGRWFEENYSLPLEDGLDGGEEQEIQ